MAGKTVQDEQKDALERIESDAESAGKALLKIDSAPPEVLRRILCSDVFPLIRAMAAEVGERDSDLDERVSALEETLDDAIGSIVGAQRGRMIDILERTIVLGEEVRGLILPPSDELKVRAQALSALAAEALQDLKSEEPESDEDTEEGEGNASEGE